jgi:mRNA interferase RelE/StbE
VKFSVRLDKRTCKVLDHMPSDVRHRVVLKFESLEDDPRPPDAVKLVGVEGLYRVRVGDWRIVYAIRDCELVVVVIRIGHRREVYR